MCGLVFHLNPNIYVNDKLCKSEVSKYFYFQELKPHNHSSGNVTGHVHHSPITSTNMLYNAKFPKDRRCVSSSKTVEAWVNGHGQCGAAHTPSQEIIIKKKQQPKNTQLKSKAHNMVREHIGLDERCMQ